MRTASPVRGIVFDLDGTLVDSLPDVTSALSAALVSAGLSPVTQAQVEPAMGHGALELVTAVVATVAGEHAVEPHRIEQICTDYQRAYAAAPAVATKPFADAVSALTSLYSNGIVLGVCTNKTTDLAHEVLRAVGLDACMSSVIGRDSTPYPKPDSRHLLAVIEALDLTPDAVLYVGDNPIDATVAKGAGVTYRHVAWGVPLSGVAHLERFADLGELVDLHPQASWSGRRAG